MTLVAISKTEATRKLSTTHPWPFRVTRIAMAIIVAIKGTKGSNIMHWADTVTKGGHGEGMPYKYKSSSNWAA